MQDFQKSQTPQDSIVIFGEQPNDPSSAKFNFSIQSNPDAAVSLASKSGIFYGRKTPLVDSLVPVDTESESLSARANANLSKSLARAGTQYESRLDAAAVKDALERINTSVVSNNGQLRVSQPAPTACVIRPVVINGHTLLRCQNEAAHDCIFADKQTELE